MADRWTYNEPSAHTHTHTVTNISGGIDGLATGKSFDWGDRRVYIGLIYIIHTRIAYIRTSIRQD